jgi:hypothetical protein
MVGIKANPTLPKADNRDGVRRLRPRPPVNPTQRQTQCLRELGDRQQWTDTGFFLGSHLNRVETPRGCVLESFSSERKTFLADKMNLKIARRHPTAYSPFFNQSYVHTVHNLNLWNGDLQCSDVALKLLYHAKCIWMASDAFRPFSSLRQTSTIPSQMDTWTAMQLNAPFESEVKHFRIARSECVPEC